MKLFSHVRFAALSDLGRKRKNNEDACGAFPSYGIFVVADGMGGGDDGEVASATTVRAVDTFIKEHPLPSNGTWTSEDLVKGLSLSVGDASRWIWDRAREKKLKGCGSTFVGLLLDASRPTEAIVLHAGDSRLYRIRGGKIQQITKDHSAAEMIGARNETEINPMFRGMILRAVGIQPTVELERTPLPLEAGDRILICSDGLSRMVVEDRIAELVCAEEEPDRAVRSLIDAANEAGGIDNITALVVCVGDLPPPVAAHPMPPDIRSASADAAGSSSGTAQSDTAQSITFGTFTSISSATVTVGETMDSTPCNVSTLPEMPFAATVEEDDPPTSATMHPSSPSVPSSSSVPAESVPSAAGKSRLALCIAGGLLLLGLGIAIGIVMGARGNGASSRSGAFAVAPSPPTAVAAPSPAERAAACKALAEACGQDSMKVFREAVRSVDGNGIPDGFNDRMRAMRAAVTTDECARAAHDLTDSLKSVFGKLIAFAELDAKNEAERLRSIAGGAPERKGIQAKIDRYGLFCREARTVVEGESGSPKIQSKCAELIRLVRECFR